MGGRKDNKVPFFFSIPAFQGPPCSPPRSLVLGTPQGRGYIYDGVRCVCRGREPMRNVRIADIEVSTENFTEYLGYSIQKVHLLCLRPYLKMALSLFHCLVKGFWGQIT